MTSSERAAIAALAQRRLAHEPVARILGVKEFWGLPFRLNEETLVPRPETETVVEEALAALGPRRQHALRIADLGTGSGALLLALLSECSTAVGIGTDLSTKAVACARCNAGALQLHERTAFTVCNYGAALKGSFDLVFSNPPYLRRRDIATLQPRCACSTGTRARRRDDGLHGYRRLQPMRAGCSPRRPDSCGARPGQASAVQRFFSAGLRSRAHVPISQVPRALLARARHESVTQIRHAKKHLDCGPRPIRVPAGIDPRRSAAPI